MGLELGDEKERLHAGGGGGELHLVGVGLESALHRIQDGLLVVHHEKAHRRAAQLLEIAKLFD